MSLLDSVSRFMGISRKREHLDSSMYRRVGTSKTHKTCERCGKTKLKQTHAFERSDGTRVYLGSECAHAREHRDSAVLAAGFAQMPPRMSVEDFKKKFPGVKILDRITKELYNWNGYGMRVTMDQGEIAFYVWDQYAQKFIESAVLKHEKTPLGEIVAIDKNRLLGVPTKIIQIWLDTFPKWDPIKEHVTSVQQPVQQALAGSKPGKNFAGRNLRGANLSGKDLNNADFTNSDLTDADLRSAYLSDASFRGASLPDSIMKNANMMNADFHGADLDGADFSLVVAGGAKFTKAIATNMNFDSAYLNYADFAGADLRGSKFFGAELIGTDFSGAILTGTKFGQYANLSKTIMGNWAVDPATGIAWRKP